MCLMLLGSTEMRVCRLPLRPGSRRYPTTAGVAAGTRHLMPPIRYRHLHAAIQAGLLVASCHDVSEGGLAVALGEMCIGRTPRRDHQQPVTARRPGDCAVQRVARPTWSSRSKSAAPRRSSRIMDDDAVIQIGEVSESGMLSLPWSRANFGLRSRLTRFNHEAYATHDTDVHRAERQELMSRFPPVNRRARHEPRWRRRQALEFAGADAKIVLAKRAGRTPRICWRLPPGRGRRGL